MLAVFIYMHILKVEGVGLQLAPFFVSAHDDQHATHGDTTRDR